MRVSLKQFSHKVRKEYGPIREDPTLRDIQTLPLVDAHLGYF